MNSNGEISEKRKKFKEIKIINPFVRDKNYWDEENVLFDKIKVIKVKSFKWEKIVTKKINNQIKHPGDS